MIYCCPICDLNYNKNILRRFFIMFKNRKLIILSALLLLLVLIGSASAAEVDDIQQVTQDGAGEIVTEKLSSAGIDDNSGLQELENDNVLSNSLNESSENDNVLTANIPVSGSTFQDIQDAIDAASDGDTILLNSQLYTGSGTQINVNKNQLTIIGSDGCTLINSDGRTFYVTGHNVTLKNIVIENSTSQLNIQGGAIFWAGANGTVSNCNFTNNRISRYGGAIYWTGANGTVSNCYFTKNEARSGGAGGAIYWSGANPTITDSIFMKNGAIAGSATNWGHGGAIYLTGANANISNCKFIDGNSEPYSIAGAIYCTGANPTIFNSSFTNNRAIGAGIYLYSNKGIVSISSCNFTENRASGTGTGAIDLITANAIISDCNFKNNRGYYGAISWTQGNGTISNCNFTDNYGGHTGGAIELGYFNGTVSNCNFISNRGDYYYGGAINCAKSNVTISDSNFTNNSAPEGGAIHWSGSDINVSNCNFTNNKVVKSTDRDGSALCYGGAISGGGSGNTVSNCNFINNTAKYGGAIFAASGITLNDNDFSGNVADGRGGAIYCTGNNITVSNSDFISNVAEYSYGGAIYCTGNNITLSNSNLINNRANNGGAIYWDATTGYIAKSNFTYNIADTGSAIYMNKDGKISDSYFMDNKASSMSLSSAQNSEILRIGFTGYDNYINAIYSYNEISFNNVTYWNGSVVNSDVATPVKSDYEKGINITLEIYDKNNNLVDNITKMTDAEGYIYYDYSNFNVTHTYKAYHSEDTYYTYTQITGIIPVLPELTINKTANENVVTNGSLVNFTIKVSNIGKHDIPFIIYDMLPYGFEFVEASEGWLDYYGYPAWNITSLPPGQNTTVWVVAKATMYGSFTNYAIASDEYYYQIYDTATVNVLGPLSINKTVDKSVVSKDSLVNFTIEVSNTGETELTQIVIADFIPEGLTFVEASEGWTQGYYIAWNIPSLAAGQSTTVWVVANATNYGTFINQALSASEDVPNYLVSDDATVTVSPVILTIDKVASANEGSIGDEITFTINVTNVGVEKATDVIITDILPDGLTLVEGELSYNISSLEAGQSHIITIKAQASKAGNFTNKATAYCLENPIVVSDTAKVTIQKSGTIVTVDKIVNYTGAVVVVIANVTDANGNPITGGTATFTIYYNNPLGSGLLMANTAGTAKYTTDVIDGKATFNDITLGAPGKYPSTIEYSGNDNYDYALENSEVDVLPLNTTVESDDISGSAGEKTDIVANIVDQNGKPVQNGTAILKINGKEYTADVKNGIATFKNVELPSEDTEATIEYKGNDYYNPSNKTVQITINEEPEPEPQPDNDIVPDTPENNTGKQEQSQSLQKEVMKETGNPIFLLIMAVLACLPILRRKQ